MHGASRYMAHHLHMAQLLRHCGGHRGAAALQLSRRGLCAVLERLEV
jgi:hypothetical protein